MASLNSVYYKHWSEVESINSYAIFMGYLLMGVRGLGLLVLTWTTVVLLGGFVTMLSKKDFWCLTLITLVQVAGVFDFILKEKASDIVESWSGLLATIFAVILRPWRRDSKMLVALARFALAGVLLLVQLLVLAIVLCTMAVLYVLGLYISTGISLWRLIQYDYGNSNAEGGANLKPALNVLYSLAVAQGVVYVYRSIYDLVARSGLVEEVADNYKLETDLVSAYLDETVTGCMKDPSFARGRNLTTYAVGLLMQSKSRHSYVSGVLILGTDNFGTGQPGLIKQLLTASTAFNHVVQRLLETFGSTSPYSTEIRECAARIVAHVAGSVRLKQLPEGMIHCVSALLDTFEEFSWRPDEPYPGFDLSKPQGYDRDWLLELEERTYLEIERPGVAADIDVKATRSAVFQGYKRLVVQGLRILQKLTVDEDNCRVVSNTEGLLSKIMAPLFSDQLHRDYHDEWCSLPRESLELMSWLMAAPGDAGVKLRHQISANSREIASTIQSILKCGKCGYSLRLVAVEILLDLLIDTSASILASGSTGAFVAVLVHLFSGARATSVLSAPSIPWWIQRQSHIRVLAAQELLAICKVEASVMSQLISDFLGRLVGTVIHDRNNARRLLAAQILEHLCLHYTKDDGHLKDLKQATAVVVIPRVLGEILIGYGSTGSEATYSAPDADVEEGRASSSQDNSNEQQNRKLREDSKLQEGFVSLCATICEKWTRTADSDLACRFDEIAAKICSEQGKPVKTFTALVEEAQSLLKKKA